MTTISLANKKVLLESIADAVGDIARDIDAAYFWNSEPKKIYSVVSGESLSFDYAIYLDTFDDDLYGIFKSCGLIDDLYRKDDKITHVELHNLGYYSDYDWEELVDELINDYIVDAEEYDFLLSLTSEQIDTNKLNIEYLSYEDFEADVSYLEQISKNNGVEYKPAILKFSKLNNDDDLQKKYDNDEIPFVIYRNDKYYVFKGSTLCFDSLKDCLQNVAYKTCRDSAGEIKEQLNKMQEHFEQLADDITELEETMRYGMKIKNYGSLKEKVVGFVECVDENQPEINIGSYCFDISQKTDTTSKENIKKVVKEMTGVFNLLKEHNLKTEYDLKDLDDDIVERYIINVLDKQHGKATTVDMVYDILEHPYRDSFSVPCDVLQDLLFNCFLLSEQLNTKTITIDMAKEYDLVYSSFEKSGLHTIIFE